MGVSKVVYGDDTLVDLTGDTVTPTSLTLGATAHAANGERIVGEYQYVLPPMSSDIRGGARIQPDSGLEITDTDNLQVRLALESDGTVRGGISQLTAKGHAEQDGTPTPDNPVPIQVVRGRNLIDVPNGSMSAVGYAFNLNNLDIPAGTYTLNAIIASGANKSLAVVTGSTTPINIRIELPYTFTVNETITGMRLYVDGTGDYSDVQLTLGSTPQPYVPYGHVGMEAQSKNLLDVQSGISGGTGYAFNKTGLNIAAGTYTLSLITGGAWSYAVLSNGTRVAEGEVSRSSVTFSSASAIDEIRAYVGPNTAFSNVMLELGPTATAYEPYYHTTTPIPLPSRGWVAGLPDGTADSLRLDGAGKCEWELKDAETTTAATDGVTGTIGVDMLSTTGQIADGATVLYKLATPVTEDCGYCEDWPTDIPEGAVVSCPELDAVGVKYFIDSAVTELARQWYARAEATIGQAVVELAERVNQLENA